MNVAEGAEMLAPSAGTNLTWTPLVAMVDGATAPTGVTSTTLELVTRRAVSVAVVAKPARVIVRSPATKSSNAPSAKSKT